MVTRNPSREGERGRGGDAAARRRGGAAATRGSTSLQLLVILVPVIFGFMGFAFDLGRLYLIRGELNQAAAAMALAGAAKLIGTADATERATEAANVAIDDATGHGAKYNFGAVLVGAGNGMLTSEAPLPAFFSTMAGATGDSDSSLDQADGTTARYVQLNLTADAPLLFWSLLSLGQARVTPIAARAVAGLSAPVCTACGIEPLAIAAIDAEDTTDFGFTAATRYTFAYQCNVNPSDNQRVSALAGASQIVSYVMLDRYDDTSTLEEGQQLYRAGAQGLLPSLSQVRACMQIGATEVVWGTNGGMSAAATFCSSPPPSAVSYVQCGLYTRFATDVPTACQTNITDVETLAAAYQPDTDVADLDDYTAYTGNTRRVITVPVVDVLGAETMTVLGFRQFLLEPNAGDVALNPSDQDARFVALYLGMNQADNLTTPVPLKSGRIEGCQNGLTVTAGPGKVVLHQ